MDVHIKAVIFDLGNVLIDFDHTISAKRISKFTEMPWNDIFFLTKHNRFVYNLAQDLRKTYKLALLSNINILHFDYLKKNFSIFKPFHHIILSYEVGLRKPDPLIYKKK